MVKISEAHKERIYELLSLGKNVTDILEQLRSEGIKISRASIYKYTKSPHIETFKLNTSKLSYEAEPDAPLFKRNEFDDDEFNESFHEERKSNIEFGVKEVDKDYRLIEEIRQLTSQAAQDVLGEVNKEIKQSNDKLDLIIQEAKKSKPGKPLNLKQFIKEPVNLEATEELSEAQQKERRDLIVKIRNFIDCFADHEIILETCGNDLSAFKRSLYDIRLEKLKIVYENIQIALSQSKDFDNFMHMFSSGLKVAELFSNLLLGLSLTGLQAEVLEEIDIHDLKMLACEMSISRYVSPKMRIALVTMNIILKKILSSPNLQNVSNDVKTSLWSYYRKINAYLGRK